MERFARFVLIVNIVLVPSIVLRGPMFGFDVPKVVTIALTGTLLAVLSAPRAKPLWQRAGTEGRIVLGSSLGFGLWALVATVLSDTPMLSTLGPDSRFVGTVVLVLPIAQVLAVPVLARTYPELDRLLLVLTLTMGVIATYATIQVLGLDPMPWGTSRWGRPVATFGNSNFVGAMLSAGVPLALALFVRRPADLRRRLWALALFTVTLVALVFAEARLGWVAATAGAIAFALSLPVTRWRQLQSWLIAAIPTATVFAGLGVVWVGFRLLEDRTSLAREGYWSAAVPMWADNALVGVGVGRFQAFHRFYRPESAVIEQGRDATVDSSHAWLLDLLATTGTPGALLWLVVLVGTGLLLRRAWLRAAEQADSDVDVDVARARAQQVRIALMVGLLAAHGTQSSISVPIAPTVWLGWLLVALSLGVALATAPAPARRRSRNRRTIAQDFRERDRSAAPSGGVSRETVVAVAAVVLVGTVAVPAWSVWLSSWNLGDSAKYRSAEDYDEAARVTAEATARTPWWPRTWDEESAVAMLRGRQQHALETSLASLDADPRNRLALRQLVRISAWIDDEDASEPWYERLAELDPRGYDLHREMAEWAIDTGRYELAEHAIEVARAAIEPGMRQQGQLDDLSETLAEARAG